MNLLLEPCDRITQTRACRDAGIDAGVVWTWGEVVEDTAILAVDVATLIRPISGISRWGRWSGRGACRSACGCGTRGRRCTDRTGSV